MLLTTFVLISSDFQNYCDFTCKIAKDSLKMPHRSMASNLEILITLSFLCDDRLKKHNLDNKVYQSSMIKIIKILATKSVIQFIVRKYVMLL